MPVTPNKKFEVIQRRQKVADFYVQGWTQTAIAAEVDVSQPTICEDLQQILHQWKESAVRDYDEARDIQLQKLDRVEREAWAAWERSQKPIQSAVISGRGGYKSERRSLKNQQRGPVNRQYKIAPRSLPKTQHSARHTAILATQRLGSRTAVATRRWPLDFLGRRRRTRTSSTVASVPTQPQSLRPAVPR